MCVCVCVCARVWFQLLKCLSNGAAAQVRAREQLERLCNFEDTWKKEQELKQELESAKKERNERKRKMWEDGRDQDPQTVLDGPEKYQLAKKFMKIKERLRI